MNDVPIATEFRCHIVEDVKGEDLRKRADVVGIFDDFCLVAFADEGKRGLGQMRHDEIPRLAMRGIIDRHTNDIRKRVARVERRGADREEFGRIQDRNLGKFLLEAFARPGDDGRLEDCDLAVAYELEHRFDDRTVEALRSRRSPHGNEYYVACRDKMFVADELFLE